MTKINLAAVDYELSADSFAGTTERFFARIEHREKLVLSALILVALLIRLILMFILETYQFPTEKSMGAEMGWIARSLADGEGFKVGSYYAWMAPLYPFLLSLIFRLFGSYTVISAIVTLATQSIISSLVVIPLYFVGKLLFNPRVGTIAAVLWVFHPSSLQYAMRFVWSSSLTALGLAIMILLFLQLSRRPEHVSYSLLCGLAVGLTALSDPVILLFVPFAALWLLWRFRKRPRSTIINLTLVFIMASILMSPWIIRNYRIFHRFVPIKSTFGVNLWQGNYGPGINQPTAGIGFWNRVEDRFTENEVSYLLSFNEVERAKIFQNKAIDFIVANPEVFVTYTIQRIYLFWRHNVLQIKGMFLVPFYLLTLIGIITSRKQLPETLLLLILFVVFPIPYYLTIADTHRYRFPIEGLLLIFVASIINYFLDLALFARNRKSVGVGLQTD